MKKTKQPPRQAWYRKHMLAMSIGLLLVIILGVAAWVWYGAWADENNVARMNTTVKQLVDNIQTKDPRFTWKDQSSCNTSQPRLFGENVYHSCSSRWVALLDISNQAELDSVIHSVASTLNTEAGYVYDIGDYASGRLKLADEQKNIYYTAIQFAIKNVNLHPAKCDISFNIKEKPSAIKLECSTSTKRAY